MPGLAKRGVNYPRRKPEKSLSRPVNVQFIAERTAINLLYWVFGNISSTPIPVSAVGSPTARHCGGHPVSTGGDHQTDRFRIDYRMITDPEKLYEKLDEIRSRTYSFNC